MARQEQPLQLHLHWPALHLMILSLRRSGETVKLGDLLDEEVHLAA